MEQSGYPLAGIVTECHGADIHRYKCHGLFAERISVARFFSQSGLSQSVEQTAQNRVISPQCTVAIVRKNDTVNRENGTGIREFIPLSMKGHVVLADNIDRFVGATLWRPTPSTKGEYGAQVNVAFLEETNTNKNIE